MKIYVLTALMASAFLTACGGGGGGGSVTPPTGGGTQNQARLAAGFSVTMKGSALMHTSRYHAAVTHQAALGSSILPFAIFWVPDSYVPANSFPTPTYSEVAYATGGAVSNPGPVTFTPISGPILPVVATPTPFPQPAGLPSGAQLLGGQIVGAPTQIGQSVITVSAIGQTVSLTGDNYRGTELSTASNSDLHGPTGLSFGNVNGGSPVSSGPSDLSFSGDGSGATAFVAPNGIIELVGKTIDQVQGSDFVQANAQTTLTPTALCSSQPVSYIFKTAGAGNVLVKFEAEGLFYGGTYPQGTCAVTDMPAVYQVSDLNGNFSF